MSARGENDYDREKKCPPTWWHLHRYIPTRLYVIAIAIRSASVSCTVNTGNVSAASLFAYKRIAISLPLPRPLSLSLSFLFVNFRRRGDKSLHMCKNIGGNFSAASVTVHASRTDSFVIRAESRAPASNAETQPEIISVVYAFIMHLRSHIFVFFENNVTAHEHMSHLSPKCRKSNFTNIKISNVLIRTRNGNARNWRPNVI